MHGIMSIYVSGVVLACGYFTISLVWALKCLVIFDGRFSGCRERNRLIDIPENSKVYRCWLLGWPNAKLFVVRESFFTQFLLVVLTQFYLCRGDMFAASLFAA